MEIFFAKKFLIVGAVWLAALTFSFSQVTVTCVDKSNQATVTCNSCSDIDIDVAEGLLVVNGSADRFLYSPIKAFFRNNGVVTLIGAHGNNINLTLSEITGNPTEAEFKEYLRGCVNVELEFSLDGNMLSLVGVDTVDLSSISGSGSGDTNQILSFSNDTVYLSNGGFVDLGPYLDNTDNQQISISDNEILLEDGGSITIPQSQITYSQSDSNSVLVEGDIVNSGNGVILEYYFNSLPLFTSGSGSGTDDQNLSDFTLDDQGMLSISIEDGNTVTADLSSLDVEVEPQTLGIIGSVISISDGNSITLPVDQFEANTDDQQLSFDDATDELTLEAGGSVNLSKYNNSNGECMELVVNASTAISPIDLPQDQAGRSVYINGIKATEQSILSRVQHVSINPTTNEVTFYESLDNDVVAFCRN